MSEKFDVAAALAQRAKLADEGAITRVVQKTRELVAQGRDIISLSIGEPDFDTPELIKAEAVKAMQHGFTHYSPAAGMPVLKEAIAAKLLRENNLRYAAADIVVSNGAKQAITNAMLALVEPGDEVILLAPYWTAYELVVQFVEGKAVILSASSDENYKVPAARIAAALTDKSKLLIINSPCNPSGAVWSAEELAEIAELVASHPRLMVLSDEIYEYISFDSPVTSFASLPGMWERTVTVNGLSKAFAMTGWRLGYTAAPAPITRAIMQMQSTLTAGANQFVQIAGAEALNGSRDAVLEMQGHYRRRRDLVMAALREIPGVKLSDIPASFYALPDVSGLLGKKAGNVRLNTIEEMADWLLVEHGVAVVPGTSFGAPGSFRLSFATAEDKLITALARLKTALCLLS